MWKRWAPDPGRILGNVEFLGHQPQLKRFDPPVGLRPHGERLKRGQPTRRDLVDESRFACRHKRRTPSREEALLVATSSCARTVRFSKNERFGSI